MIRPRSILWWLIRWQLFEISLPQLLHWYAFIVVHFISYFMTKFSTLNTIFYKMLLEDIMFNHYKAVFPPKLTVFRVMVISKYFKLYHGKQQLLIFSIKNLFHTNINHNLYKIMALSITILKYDKFNTCIDTLLKRLQFLL